MSEVGLPGEIVLEIPIGQFAKKKCYGLDMGKLFEKGLQFRHG